MQIKVDTFKGTVNTDSALGDLTTALRDVADDMVTLTPAAVASTSAAVTAVADASGDVGSGALANDLKAKYNAMVTLVNELKTRLNAISSGTLKTTKV